MARKYWNQSFPQLMLYGDYRPKAEVQLFTLDGYFVLETVIPARSSDGYLRPESDIHTENLNV